MIRKYQRHGNIAASIMGASLIGLVFSFSSGDVEYIWTQGHYLDQSLFIIFATSWFYMLWAYAKSKGRSGLWALAGIFTWIGLVVLLRLKDKDNQTHHGSRKDS
jgi:hypothetical protein